MRSRAKERERQGRREKGGGGEVGATKAKRKEQRVEEEGRGGHRVVVFVWGEWMKSLSLTQETRLLSHILSLGFYHSLLITLTPASLPLFNLNFWVSPFLSFEPLSFPPFSSIPLSPLFLSSLYSAPWWRSGNSFCLSVLLFLIVFLWRKQDIPQSNFFCNFFFFQSTLQFPS